MPMVQLCPRTFVRADAPSLPLNPKSPFPLRTLPDTPHKPNVAFCHVLSWISIFTVGDIMGPQF